MLRSGRLGAPVVMPPILACGPPPSPPSMAVVASRRNPTPCPAKQTPESGWIRVSGRLSEKCPAHTREKSEVANWLPVTRPTTKVLKAKALMHMQRQYRQSEANNKKGNQHSAHNG